MEDEKKISDNLIVLSSAHSTQISLEAVRNGKAGLDAHRQSLLDKVPVAGSYAEFRRGTLNIKDLAYLSAKEGVEFAILQGKNKDILFRGDSRNCLMEDPLKEELESGKLRIVGHSHTGEPVPIPSGNDREALRRIKQPRSTIISAMTGVCTDFGQDPFELPGEAKAIDSDCFG